MKLDPHIIRRLREERAWSQDHLATAARVSLRTIQRVEGEGSVSAETRLSLAAAFGVDVAQLAGRSPAAAEQAPSTEPSSPAIHGASAAHLLHSIGGSPGESVPEASASFRQGSARQSSADVAQPTLGWIAHLRRTGFIRHATICVGVIALLAWLDLRARDGMLWFQWPLLGWGAGIASHGIRSWRAGRPPGSIAT